MGNNSQNRIVVLDDNQNKRDKYNEGIDSNYILIFYNKFEEFIQKQNPKQLQNVIVRVANTINQNFIPQLKDKGAVQNTNQKSMKQIKSSQKSVIGPQQAQQEDFDIQRKNIKKQTQNPFKKICPFLRKEKKSLRDELIQYVKTYLLDINIYFYVDEITNTKLLQYERPYVELVSDNLSYIINSMSQQNQKKNMSIKMNRMFQGLYRKIMVKIIDPHYNESHEEKDGKKYNKLTTKLIKQKQQFLKQNKIAFQFNQTVSSFEKSNISTACQYVICTKQNLSQLIDSKIICSQSYNIILLQENKQIVKQTNQINEGKEKKKQNNQKKDTNEKNQYNQIGQERIKKYVWASHHDFKYLISMMKNCSQISKEEAPQLSENTIVCGDDETFLQNCQKLQKQLAQKMGEKAKKLNFTFLGLANKSNQINAKCKILSNAQFQEQLLDTLKKSVYSYVVVFTEDQFLQKIKNILRIENMHNRVQLTNIKLKKQNNKYTIQQKQKSLYEKKRDYMIAQVKYQIKFELGPLFNIHLYKRNDRLFSFLSNNLGIQVSVIEDKIDLQKNYARNYQRIISSQHLVCDVDNYKSEIKGFLEQMKSQSNYLSNLKIIIIDQRKKIMQFVNDDFIQDEEEKQKKQKVVNKFGIKSDQINALSALFKQELKKIQTHYIENLVFVDFDYNRLRDYIKYCKGSTVSIPFFKKGVLTTFEQNVKKIKLIKKSNMISMKSTVVSSNTILKTFLNNQIKFTTEYNIQLIVFSSTRKQNQSEIKYFQDQYIGSYVKLWCLSYEIFQSQHQLNTIKQDIRSCLYKCKSYDLLTVSDQDFYLLYIKTIQNCRNIFDLQVACIYIMSLPHGFNQAISHLFKNTQQSKLAIKTFVGYIVVLFTSFCQFGLEQMGFVQLVSMIDQQKFDKKLQNLRQRDTVYTSDFIFCSDLQETGETDNKHVIIFEFQNVQFIEKTRVRDYIEIQKYAFYKQGAQYLIAPFAKFQVVSVQKKDNGKYQIRLSNVKNYSKSFLNRVLLENQIKQNMLLSILEEQFRDKKKYFQLTIQKDKISSYKKAEITNLLQSKEQTKKQFEQNLDYNNFFKSKNAQMFLTALKYLQSKVAKVNKKQQQTGQLSERQRQQIKMIGVQYSFLHFKMAEFSKSLIFLNRVMDYMSQQKIQIDEKAQDYKNEGCWKLKALHKFKKSVQSTIENRKKLILCFPKRKIWKLKLVKKQNDNKMAFQLKSKSQKWKVQYDIAKQVFPLQYNQQLNKNRFINKVLVDKKKLIPIMPENQFGVSCLSWFNSELFLKYTMNRVIQGFAKMVSIAANEQHQKPDKKQEIQIKQQYKKPSRAIRNSNNFKQMNWQVFYLGDEVKIISKQRKHFHAKIGKR